MKKNRKPSGLTIGKSIIIVFLSLTLIFFSAVFIFLNFYKPSLDMAPESEIVNLPSGLEFYSGEKTTDETGVTGDSGNKKNDFYNILICGESGGNTDTIMIASFDVENQRLSVLSIPRDTYLLTTPSSSSWKINAVFRAGYDAAKKNGKENKNAILDGLKALGASVKYTFGIPVHCGVYVDTAGFRELVDLVKGVEVNVPFEMYQEIPDQGFVIDLKPGLQTLSGKDAEAFARYREGYDDQDYGRIEAQRQVVTALVKKCMSQKEKIPQLIGAGYKYIATDLNAADILYFAKETVNLKPENIRFNTAPSEAKKIGEGWYVVLYKEETMQIINKYHNCYAEDLPPEKFNIAEFERVATWKEVSIDGVTMNQIGN